MLILSFFGYYGLQSVIVRSAPVKTTLEVMLASVHSAPARIALVKLAPLIVASWSFAKERSAPVKFVS